MSEWTEFDRALDALNYEHLERSKPDLIAVITAMLKNQKKPDDIARRVTAVCPHMWVESQQVKSAARHLQREIIADISDTAKRSVTYNDNQ